MPSIFVFTSTSLLSLTFAVLQKQYQGDFGKFQGSGKSRSGGSEKDRYFLKIPKWQHKLVRDYKRGKLVSYFLNNAAKTCLHGLKIQSKVFFHLGSNLRTSCLSAFKGRAAHLASYICFTRDVNQCWNRSVSHLYQPSRTPFLQNTYHWLLSKLTEIIIEN